MSDESILATTSPVRLLRIRRLAKLGLAALAGIALAIGYIDDTTEKSLRICQRIGLCEAPPANGQAIPPAAGSMPHATPDPNNAALLARIRRVLALEGVQLPPDGQDDPPFIDLAAPVVGPPEPAPAGAPLPYGVSVTLEARLRRGSDAATPPLVIRREARGIGTSAAEAEARARLAAADLLGLRLAEILQ